MALLTSSLTVSACGSLPPRSQLSSSFVAEADVVCRDARSSEPMDASPARTLGLHALWSKQFFAIPTHGADIAIVARLRERNELYVERLRKLVNDVAMDPSSASADADGARQRRAAVILDRELRTDGLGNCADLP